MLKNFKTGIGVIFVFIFIIGLSGCTLIFQSGRKTDVEKIESLSGQLSELERAQKLLEERLKREIADKEVRLEMAERGLVITFLADILFDSGKATIRSSAYSALDKVAQVLIENVEDMNVGIEGHTDNAPIKVSGWKSNWELSAQRALSVLHYIVDERGVSGDRVSAIGYGEFHPIASNDIKEGRQSNRRVEIVILPKVSKVGTDEAQKEEPVGQVEPNLK